MNSREQIIRLSAAQRMRKRKFGPTQKMSRAAQILSQKHAETVQCGVASLSQIILKCYE